MITLIKQSIKKIKPLAWITIIMEERKQRVEELYVRRKTLAALR
jgi:hypothetical protein